MTKLVRLTDIQLILLATAAARDNGSLLPPPETLGEGPARIRKEVASLIRRGLAAETALPSGADAWRTDGDCPIGVVITDEGRAAIHVEPEESLETKHEESGDEASIADTPPAPSPPAPRTKTAEVLTLLRRDEGATLDEMIAATGWLPHTTRAALTGLRQKGHAIERGKRGDITCYTLVEQVAAA